MGSRKKDDIKSNTWTTGTTEKEEKRHVYSMGSYSHANGVAIDMMQG
jgi:hypothetical protein